MVEKQIYRNVIGGILHFYSNFMFWEIISDNNHVDKLFIRKSALKSYAILHQRSRLCVIDNTLKYFQLISFCLQR